MKFKGVQCPVQGPRDNDRVEPQKQVCLTSKSTYLTILPYYLMHRKTSSPTKNAHHLPILPSQLLAEAWSSILSNLTFHANYCLTSLMLSKNWKYSKEGHTNPLVPQQELGSQSLRFPAGTRQLDEGAQGRRGWAMTQAMIMEKKPCWLHHFAKGQCPLRSRDAQVGKPQSGQLN